MVTGKFKTASGTNGGTNEICDAMPNDWGNYSITKILQYKQISATEVVPGSELHGLFSTLVASPSAGPSVTAASVTLPNDTRKDLAGLATFFNYSEQADTESALESAYPAGTYTIRFNQTGQPERVIPMNMPPTPAAIPKIANFSDAQSVNAAEPFTLQWNAFAPAGQRAYIMLILSDELGNVVFMAPNPCIPRTLEPSATSIVVPANTFKPGSTYNGILQFGITFYSSTNTIPQMAGYGSVWRTTDFTLKTAGGTGTTEPAKFTSYRLLPNGHPELTLSGTAMRSYMVQRTGSLTNPNWANVGSATMNASGTVVFEDTDATLAFPAFYRALGN
jgi:hypothetical protein